MSEEHRKPGTGRRRPAGAARRDTPGLGSAHPHRDAERQQRQRRRQALRDHARREERSRSRFTGRMAVLVLVLAVLAVSYASSLRAYLEQRSDIEAHEQRIAEAGAAIEELEKEKDRWQDPAFVQQYARKHLGYVNPGETPWVVLEDGETLSGSELPDPSAVDRPVEPAWFDELWHSTKVAGVPPEAPAATIRDDSGESE